MAKKITYKQAGVDIHRMDNFKRGIKSVVRKSFRPEVLKDIGGFGSFFKFPKDKFRDPVLVSSADGVGTKLKIAALVNKHDTIGIDAVGMNVNDILCAGAEPLFFLDYIAFSKLEEKTLLAIVKGITCGCIESNCSLIGGETAQMPGMYKAGEYDVAGFCVGAAERGRIIDGSRIMAGDVVIGLESNGLHSNGFSLVRRVLSGPELKRMSRELLRPTRIYVKPVLSLLKEYYSSIHGIAHITGGAFYDKIARILPADALVRINKNAWPVPKIFRLIQNRGNIEDKEMHHTLNMGIGMVLIAARAQQRIIIDRLAAMQQKAWIIGEVVKGKRGVGII